MKIKYVNNRGIPYFTVEAESHQDKEILSMFIDLEDDIKKYHFNFHGSTYQDSKVISFDFGLSENEYKKEN